MFVHVWFIKTHFVLWLSRCPSAEWESKLGIFLLHLLTQTPTKHCQNFWHWRLEVLSLSFLLVLQVVKKKTESLQSINMSSSGGHILQCFMGVISVNSFTVPFWLFLLHEPYLSVVALVREVIRIVNVQNYWVFINMLLYVPHALMLKTLHFNQSVFMGLVWLKQ